MPPPSQAGGGSCMYVVKDPASRAWNSSEQNNVVEEAPTMRTQLTVALVTLCALMGAWAVHSQPPTLRQAPDGPVILKPTRPGVFVPEITSLRFTIQRAETSVAAFVGATVNGPMDTPVTVTSFSDYERQFGGLHAQSPVSHAVRLFFDNGGGRAWVVRTDPAALPGGAANGTGIYALDDADPVNLLCIPEVSTPAVLAAAERYCERRRAVLLIDPPEAVSTALDAVNWLKGPDAPPRTRNCATYFPWLSVPEAPGSATMRQCGPSGAVAGVYARTDASRGVWKAPAGTTADLRGVASLTQTVTGPDVAALNPEGVNAIREMAGRGILVWGARTLSSDPEWKYVPVRRLALMIEEAIEGGTQWVVFEPNDEPTWTRVRAMVENFMQQLWRDGALQGAKAEDAWFVRCGLGTTMTATDLTEGRLNILVGFAPLKPAEFMILTITHRLPTT